MGSNTAQFAANLSATVTEGCGRRVFANSFRNLNDLFGDKGYF